MKLTTLCTILLALFLSSAAFAENPTEGKKKDALEKELVRYQKAVEANPNDMDVLYKYAQTAFELKKYHFAIPAFEQLNTTVGKKSAFLVPLASMYLSSSKKDKALDYAQEALTMDVTDAQESELLGETLYFLRQYKSAIPYFSQANQSKKTLDRLADLYTKTSQFNQAAVVFEKMIELDMDNATVYFNYSNVLLKNMQYEKAIAVLEGAQLEGFDNSFLRQNIGKSFTALKNYTEGLKQYAVAKKKGNYFRTLDMDIAECQIRAGQFGQANTTLEALAKAHPQNADIKYLQGMSKFQQGDVAAADNFFQAAVKINPDLKSSRYTKR